MANTSTPVNNVTRHPQRPADPNDITYLYVYNWVDERCLEKVIVENETYLDDEYIIVIGIYRLREPNPILNEEDLFSFGLWWEDLLDD